MTIYQQELMRKLPQFGCTGQYDEISDALAFFYDGFMIGWQDKAGYVYGAALNELTDKMCDAFYAIQEQAKAVREYTDLYETSPRMGVRDVDEYHRFAEYGDTVLAGMYSEQHGFMFSTWKQSADQSHCTEEQDYEDKLLILNPSALKDEYKSPDYQFFYAQAGFGCDPNSSGRKVFGSFLKDGERGNFYRSDFLGVIDEKYLPDWAREKLNEINEPEEDESSGMIMQ